MAGKKLLVADDSLTIQKVIRLALSSEGYEIQAVSDGNDAVQKIPLFRPDVVLIDVSLPGKSAVEVKRLINDDRDLDEVRFVLMSSAFEKIDEEMISQVRFHGKLTKPFDPAHLRQVLSEVLAEVAAERMQPTSIMHRLCHPHRLHGSRRFKFLRALLRCRLRVEMSFQTPLLRRHRLQILRNHQLLRFPFKVRMKIHIR